MLVQVRTMRESKGEVTEAGPSIAVQMVGLNSVPVAGDEFSVCSSEQEVLSFCHRYTVCSPSASLTLPCEADEGPWMDAVPCCPHLRYNDIPKAQLYPCLRPGSMPGSVVLFAGL